METLKKILIVAVLILLGYGCVSLIALGIVLEVLFNGQGIPFWPDVSVIGNVNQVLAGLSDQGLLGLVAVWILYHIYKRNG